MSSELTDPSVPLLKKAAKVSAMSAEDPRQISRVADLSILSSGSMAKSKSGDTSWYVFDNLSCSQAEDLLRQHGEDGTYLVSHFLDPESYGLSIRIGGGEDDGDAVFKHYAIGISNKEFHTEGIGGDFPTIEGLIEAVGKRLDTKLVPIFNKFDHDTSDLEITIAEEDDKPPAYNRASKFPEAARKPLPLIVPVYPTLRRMMKAQQQQQYNVENGEGGGGQILESSYVSVGGAGDPSTNHGCCWKTFHTDVNGKWYKPHKAGPVTGCLLVIGWILFLLLFGWIVGLALLLVLILIGCAGLYNFICTGRCAVMEEEEEEGEGRGGPPRVPPEGQRRRGEAPHEGQRRGEAPREGESGRGGQNAVPP